MVGRRTKAAPQAANASGLGATGPDGAAALLEGRLGRGSAQGAGSVASARALNARGVPPPTVAATLQHREAESGYSRDKLAKAVALQVYD